MSSTDKFTSNALKCSVLMGMHHMLSKPQVVQIVCGYNAITQCCSAVVLRLLLLTAVAMVRVLLPLSDLKLSQYYNNNNSQ
jgi:hypothetical protein